MKKKSKETSTETIVELIDFLNLCTPFLKQQYSKIEINLEEKGPILKAIQRPRIDIVEGKGYSSLSNIIEF